MANNMIQEKTILQYLYLSTQYCQQIVPLLSKKRLLEFKEANMMAEWACDYYLSTGEAPKLVVGSIFEDHVKKVQDEATLHYLESVVKDIFVYQDKPLNSHEVESRIEATKLYLRYRQGVMFNADVKACVTRIEQGDTQALSRLEELITNYNFINSVDHSETSLLTDLDLYREVLESKATPILSGNSERIKFYANEIVPGSLVALLAVAKAGKSWELLQLVYDCIEAGVDVGYFVCGDLSKSQVYLRSAVLRAHKHYDPVMCGTQYVPQLDCKDNQSNICRLDCKVRNESLFVGMSLDLGDLPLYHRNNITKVVRDNPTHSTCTACLYNGQIENYKPALFFSKIEVDKSLEVSDIMEVTTKNDVKLVVDHGLTPEKIDNTIKGWHDQNFYPSVIIVDYADKLCTVTKHPDQTSRMVEVWSKLSNIRLKYNLALVTATQSDTDGYMKSRRNQKLDPTNFSNSVSINKEVTALIGLTCSERFNKVGVYRLSKILSREHDASDDILCLRHLPLGLVGYASCIYPPEN